MLKSLVCSVYHSAHTGKRLWSCQGTPATSDLSVTKYNPAMVPLSRSLRGCNKSMSLQRSFPNKHLWYLWKTAAILSLSFLSLSVFSWKTRAGTPGVGADGRSQAAQAEAHSAGPNQASSSSHLTHTVDNLSWFAPDLSCTSINQSNPDYV